MTSVRVALDTDLPTDQLPTLHLVEPEQHYAADYARAPEFLPAGRERGVFNGKAELAQGTCFLWVLGDLRSATVGARVDAALESIAFGEAIYGREKIRDPSPAGAARVQSTAKRVYAYQRASMMVWHEEKPSGEVLDHVTDIAFCGMGAAADGSLHFGKMPKSSEGEESKAAFLRELDRLKALRGDRDVRIHLMIPTGPGLPQATLNVDARHRFADELTAFIVEHGLSGADIDWEYPKNASEWECHSALLYDLRTRFFPHALCLTAAGGSWKPVSARGLAMLDWINIMSYDHRPQHATFAQFLDDIKCYRKHGAHDWQINAGVPFYSHETAPNRNWDAAKAYFSIVETHPDLAPGTDEVQIDGKTHFFNGPDMIRRKAAHIRQENLGGAMIWSLVHDVHPSSDKSLLRAIHEGLDANAPEQERPKWELVWEDDFVGDTLDDRKWTLCERGRADWHNTISDDPRLLVVRDSVLHLRGIVNDRKDGDPAPYLTAGVTSKGKFAFKYGKIQIRARFKSAQGAWAGLRNSWRSHCVRKISCSTNSGGSNRNVSPLSVRNRRWR